MLLRRAQHARGGMDAGSDVVVVTVAGLADEVPVGVVHEHRVQRELPVPADQHRMAAAVQLRCPVQAVVEPDPVLADGTDLLLQHHQRQLVQVHARPPAFQEHLARRTSMQMPDAVRALRVGVEPQGKHIEGFFQRKRASAHLFMEFLVELLVPAQPRGLVGDVPARIGRREHFQAVHGPEKALNRLGLPVIRPGMDGFDSKVLVQSAGNDRASGIPDLSQERFLRKILAMPALEEPRPERLAVVDVHNAREFPQRDAGPPEGAGDTGHVLRRHHFPA